MSMGLCPTRASRALEPRYNSYIFTEQPFYGNYSTLDSHTNTVISHTGLTTRKDGL